MASEETLQKIGKIGKYILYYGGYRKNKNVDVLLEAFEKVEGYSLVLTGSSKAISNLIKEKGINDNRIFNWGFVSDEEIKCLLDNCTAFVFPSSYEGFGSPVAEALCRGARVICNNIDVLREVGGDDAVYFNSVNELSMIIQNIETISPKLTKRVLRYIDAVKLYTRVYNE